MNTLPGLLVLALGVIAGCGALALTVAGLRATWRAAVARRAARPLALRVVERCDHGRFVRLTLCRADGRRRLPAFMAGDHLTLITKPDGRRPLRRCYSLAAWTRRPGRYELLIKHEEHGVVSSWIQAHLHPGIVIDALPPRGAFHLDGAPGEVLLLAGGVGITPLRAMLHRLRAPPVTLVWAARWPGCGSVPGPP